MKLWIDDERSAPYARTHVKSAAEVNDALNSGNFSEISFDHNLGLCSACVDKYLEDSNVDEPSGCSHQGNSYEVICWLEEKSQWNTNFLFQLFTFPRKTLFGAIKQEMQAAGSIEKIRKQKMEGK